MSIENPRKSNDEHKSSIFDFSGNTKYVIAAIIFGAAVGNIFLAKKMKSIKINFFKKNSDIRQDGTTNAGPNVKWNDSTTASSSSHGTSKNTSNRDKIGIAGNDFQNFSWVPLSLKHLNLPEDELPTIDKIKDAYRKIALAHHPDSMKSEFNPENSRKIFQDATVAKEKLLAVLERL
jgi:hypothetical protein